MLRMSSSYKKIKEDSRFQRRKIKDITSFNWRHALTATVVLYLHLSSSISL